ncbi:FeoA family protein [Pseudanabaena sp. PCC 6802]|uniref:FeoA family protein n=1 Tax=Pseudanabaena sp. PCC 6802 TaxID=118173 RepID=UPI0003613ECF|nr:FeoA family protein [Pseudanabaena sp. PCC 6802]
MDRVDDHGNHGLQNFKQSPWQAFVYLSESSGRDRNVRNGEKRFETADQADTKSSMVPLAMAKVGDRVRIVSLNCDDCNNRLMAMGLMPGGVVQVVSRTATGSTIVALQDNRLGLGAEMARCIQVIDA